METTLVLDVGMQPVARIPWTTAITKILVDRRARVIEEYPDRYINTVSWSIKMPSVIMLLKPVRRSKGVKFSRHAIYLRDKGRCQYCGSMVSKKEMQYEHVIPRVQGGRTCWENIVVSCHDCNQRKADKTPAQAGMRLLSTPMRPKSLPNQGDLGLTYSPEMPESWRGYLRDYAYWNVALEQS